MSAKVQARLVPFKWRHQSPPRSRSICYGRHCDLAMQEDFISPESPLPSRAGAWGRSAFDHHAVDQTLTPPSHRSVDDSQSDDNVYSALQTLWVPCPYLLFSTPRRNPLQRFPTTCTCLIPPVCLGWKIRKDISTPSWMCEAMYAFYYGFRVISASFYSQLDRYDCPGGPRQCSCSPYPASSSP